MEVDSILSLLTLLAMVSSIDVDIMYMYVSQINHCCIALYELLQFGTARLLDDDEDNWS